MSGVSGGLTSHQERRGKDNHSLRQSCFAICGAATPVSSTSLSALWPHIIPLVCRGPDTVQNLQWRMEAVEWAILFVVLDVVVDALLFCEERHWLP
jgi:hypothetical protein